MTALELIILNDTFSIHRLAAAAAIPGQLFSAAFFAITRSADELSIVAPAGLHIESDACEPGWACLRVAGKLDFAQVGILAGISSALAKAGISLFALSTFDTDYILVKDNRLEAACEALRAAGYIIAK